MTNSILREPFAPVSPWILAAILAVALSIIAAGNAAGCLTYDEAMWTYIGRLWLEEGLVPYVHAADNKPPGIFLLFGWNHLMFGPTVWFPRACGVLAVALSAVMVGDIARRLSGPTSGFFALVFFSCSIMWKSVGGAFVTQTESFVLVCVTAGFWSLLRGHQSESRAGYVIGVSVGAVCTGCALWFKQLAVFDAAWFLTACVWLDSPHRKTIRDVALAAVLIALASALSVLPLMWSGLSWTAYADHVWWQLFLPEGPTTPSLFGRTRDFLRAFNESPMVLFYPFVIYLWMARKDRLSSGMPAAALLAWLALEFVSVNAGSPRTFYLKLLLPSLSIISGIALDRFMKTSFAEKSTPERWRGVLLGTIALMWIPIHVDNVQNVRNMIFRPVSPSLISCVDPVVYPDDTERKPLADWVRTRTTATERIYVTGYGAQIMAYSERRSSSRYFDAMFARTPGAIDDILNDLNDHPPRFVLIHRFDDRREWVNVTQREKIRAWADRNSYREIACLNGYDVLERP